MGKQDMGKLVKAVEPELERYAGLAQQIKEKSKERKNLLAEKRKSIAKKVSADESAQISA